ncbi:hypothetical protein GCK72_007178 [Caenorhabditis remanei]|uniref:Uncharacterized protein n=1 Tax=Caenorhabditis remanei TaxID=31234 RepID=E3MJ41_CAERE|nr:hypothetical protein GCK72_007178 [Caenorhabditis remanei]EFP03357.1 hypothetical protein CRE_09547 [Caenorhabditis remanei]KAF1767219.1 hypothetical protein GCK72_007178 [Caenorhabditis remanei]
MRLVLTTDISVWDRCCWMMAINEPKPRSRPFIANCIILLTCTHRPNQKIRIEIVEKMRQKLGKPLVLWNAANTM